MEAAKQMLRKDRCLPLLGPCMLIFALPLLIPGLTLTLVALWDETGFSKFSALHVLGMVLLASSGLLLLTGVILNCTLSKKAKGRVRPQLEDEDSIFSSSSSQGSQTTGYFQSTHQTTAVHTEEDHTALPDCQVTQPSQPSGQGPEEERDHPSPSGNPSPSPRQLLTVGYLPPITSASASRALPDLPQSLDSGAQTGTAGSVSGYGSQHGRSCNYMLSCSEEDEAQAARYAELAAKLMTADDGRIRTTSSVSSSSPSLSSEKEDVEEEACGVEGDPPHSDRRQEFGELPGHKPVISDPRSEALKKEKTSPSWLGHTPSGSSSSLEDRSSINNEGGHRQLRNADDVGTTRNASAERLFVARQQASGPREVPQEHSSESEEEARPIRNGGVSPKLFTLQENSSSSQCTESPSHGTYSVKSFVSEELVEKASPEQHSAVEDDVFHSTGRFLSAGSSPDGGRSVSPVPLRTDVKREWEDLGITVLGSRSGGSSQSSPEKSGASSRSSLHKQSRAAADNFGMDSKSEDDVKHSADSEHSKRKKKKKKKKKKRRRERMKGEGHSPAEMDRWEEGQLAVEDMEARPHRLSSLRSSRTLQQYPEHHVHWPDD